MILTRQQRERLVLDLYYNQGKNTLELAQEVRMSFSAIDAILKKATQENERSKEKTEKMSIGTSLLTLFQR
jgi:DNA-directed RNA polymerase specialized sigma subunit